MATKKLSDIQFGFSSSSQKRSRLYHGQQRIVKFNDYALKYTVKLTLWFIFYTENQPHRDCSCKPTKF